MAGNRYVMGLFTDEDAVAAALAALKRSSWKLHRVNGPYPSHKILDALDLPKSRVGYFTLAGGMLGFISGYALSIYSSVQWNIVVSGKPVVAPIPFFVVGYEMTILFGIIGTVIGLLVSTKIPAFKRPDDRYDPRCSGEHFGVLAECESGAEDNLAAFFRERGGEVRIFGDDPDAEGGMI